MTTFPDPASSRETPGPASSREIQDLAASRETGVLPAGQASNAAERAGEPGALRIGGARWIDSHCHLQDSYDAGLPLAERLEGAAQAGVIGVVCIGTDQPSSSAALDVVHTLRHDGGHSAVVPAAAGCSGSETLGAWATIGLHPHHAADGAASVVALARGARTAREPVVGIGECGLDYHYDNAERPVQRRVFAEQVALAVELELALVVHTRDAWDDTLDILRSEGPPQRTIIHCFTGGPDEARRSLDTGAYLSFSGIVTFKNAEEVRQAAVVCPSDRLLVETDAPFLAPAPHRGQPNRPAWVSVVGEAVARLRDMHVADLGEVTIANTRRVFAIQ